MLAERRFVIPAFLPRIDQPNRGGVWIEYLANTRRAMQSQAEQFLDGTDAEPRPEVVLADFDPDGEGKVVAAALYGAATLADEQLVAMARRPSADGVGGLQRS